MQKEDLEMRIKRLHEELKSQTTLISKLKLQLESVEKENYNLSANLNVSEEKCKSLLERFNETKEDSLKSKNVLIHKEKQFLHDLRKKEKEFEKLKEQLQMNLRERTKDKKSMGFVVLNGNISKAEDDALAFPDVNAQIAQQAEEREQVAICENIQLRKILFEIYQSLSEMFSIKTNESRQTFELPLEWSLDSIQAEFYTVFESLIQFAKASQNSTLVDSLKDEISQLNSIIENQNRILVEKGSNISSTNLNSSFEQLKTDLELKSKKLESERKELTVAALKLGKEREQFLREKMEYEESKRTNNLSDLLAELPSTPQFLRIQTPSRLSLRKQSSPFILPKKI